MVGGRLVSADLHRTNGVRNWRLCTVLQSMIAVWLWGMSSLNAAAPVIGKPTVGWNGHYVVGQWTPVVIPITVHESTLIELELTAVDSDGNRTGFLSPKTTLDPGERQLNGLIKVGRLDGEVGIRIDQGSEIRGIPGRTEWLNEPLKPSVRLVVTVGEPRGFEFDADFAKTAAVVKVVNLKANELPENSLAYDSLSSLVIAGAPSLSPAQSGAIRDWVAAGGRLVISLKQDAAVARHSLQMLSDWLPVSVANEPVVVREFGGLEAFAGKTTRIPQATTMSIPSLKLETGEVLAASRSDAFVVQAPYGMGAVTVLAMDLTTAPLSEWKALPSLCARLTGSNLSDSPEKAPIKSAQLSSTGITDLATQLHATQENFESVSRVSPWFAMGLLLIILIAVGPLDYLFVHRLLKRPHLTWITYPILVVVCAVFASLLANMTNGTERHANQLNIVNVDVVNATAQGRHFVTIYSPTTSQASVAIEPLPLAKSTKITSPARVSWQGVPESTFGGMLRPTGFEQGAKYQQQPDGQLTELPVMQWSSKALVGDSDQSAEGLVDCNLRASATGRLTGTITHHFSGAIEDWMIVYKNVVYRHLKRKDDPQSLPFHPGQLWRVDQPSVFSRELRPYLTGIITMATPRFGQTQSVDLTQQQTTYDVLSLDPANIVRILTFHQEVGGERYTGLTNQILGNEDCSHLLSLGRAILFGRLDQPVANVQLDQSPFESDRQVSFVRLILPVARSTEVLKELHRVVPD